MTTNTPDASPKQSKQPKPSNLRMYDSLTIEDYMANPDHTVITTLVQKSHRFQPFKKLAIYLFKERAYFGNYEVHSVKEYKVSQVPNLLCVWMFNQPFEKSQEQLRKLIRKGKCTPNSKVYLATLFKIGFNKSHIIKHKS